MKKILYILFFFLQNNLASATVFFEPFVGYSPYGSGETQYHQANNNTTHTYAAINYGARMGVSLNERLFIGADYGAQSHALSSTKNSVETNDLVLRTQFGAFAHILDEGFIYYVAYFPMISVKGRDEVSGLNQVYKVSDRLDEGYAYSAGVFYRLSMHASLGLIYRHYTYSALSSSGVASTTFSSLKLWDVMVAISFPFAIVK